MPTALLAVPALLALALLPGCAEAAPRENGRAGWLSPSPSLSSPSSRSSSPACPCANASLCEPVRRVGPERVYAFHDGRRGTPGWTAWRHYNWSLITTVCVFGEVDPELLCHAHANQARVTLGNGGPRGGVAGWRNETVVARWVGESVAAVQAAFADGFNIDIEVGVSDPTDVAALTALSRRAADAMHAANPDSHVTFDVPSEGLAQEGCGRQYGRLYAFRALAEALDFLVVMDYDSGSPHSANPEWVHFASGPPGHVYIYPNRTSARAACVGLGFPGLCRKAELAGHSDCAIGWCEDWEGYWMATTSKGCGHAGYNPCANCTGGAYCCGYRPPCATCFFANAALPVVKVGVGCFASLGVPASKLVLAFPWYGYDYTCDAGDTPTGLCTVRAAQQLGYPAAAALLATRAIGGRQWWANSSTPHFFYRDANATLHRVDYDDSQSLRLKYAYARAAGARGVGMWTASSLNYSDTATAQQFWRDLELF